MRCRTQSATRGRVLLLVLAWVGIATHAVDAVEQYHGRPLSDWGVLPTDYRNGVEGCECLTDVRARPAVDGLTTPLTTGGGTRGHSVTQFY